MHKNTKITFKAHTSKYTSNSGHGLETFLKNVQELVGGAYPICTAKHGLLPLLLQPERGEESANHQVHC